MLSDTASADLVIAVFVACLNSGCSFSQAVILCSSNHVLNPGTLNSVVFRGRNVFTANINQRKVAKIVSVRPDLLHIQSRQLVSTVKGNEMHKSKLVGQ